MVLDMSSRLARVTEFKRWQLTDSCCGGLLHSPVSRLTNSELFLRFVGLIFQRSHQVVL